MNLTARLAASLAGPSHASLGGEFVVCLAPVSVISTTLCYPNPSSPTQGIFVQRRLREVSRLVPLEVIAPIPWFPGLRGAGGAGDPSDQTPQVIHPRMFFLPGSVKSLDGRFYARAFGKALRARLGRDGVRLIDAHFVWPDGVGAWRVARRAGVPFVCTIRGKLVSQIANRSKRRQIEAMLRDADALIAVSRSLADLANEVSGRDLGVRVIPNGVDGEVFRREDRVSARAAMAWSTAVRYVISVGHQQELKGFHRLVEVWGEVRRRCGDLRLVLVGGGAGEPAYAARLRRAAERLGPDVVEIAGRVSSDRVATMLNAADLFVLASRSEGSCNALAESLACGCPAVVTDVGGNAEILGEPGSGRLVPFGDPAALTDAVCAALDHPWDRDRIAEVGGRRTWQQVARECVDVFESVFDR